MLKRIFFLFISTFNCFPNEHQRQVVEELRRIEQPVVYNSNEKLNLKMKGDPYPEDFIDCSQFQVCRLCSAEEGYQITHQNNYLIGLHYNYKQEIKDLYEILSHFVNKQHLYYSLSKKGICVEKLTNIFETLKLNSFDQMPFPQIFRRENNITLHNILLIAQFHSEWTFQIQSLNYTGSCLSNFLVCQEFHQLPQNKTLTVQGVIKGNSEILYQITQKVSEKSLKILKIELPDPFFDNLIRMFFGERFIEQIEYEQHQNYLIEIIEKNQKGNHELILILEVS